MADANFANVSLLLRANGADASTDIVDESPNAFADTVFGSAQLDTAQKKYGTASLFLSGSSARVKFPDDDDFEFGTGDFTIEAWVRLTTTIVTNEEEGVIVSKNDSSYRSPFTLGFDGFNFSFRAWNTSNTEVVSLYDTTTISGNTWYHVAATRSGNTFRLFVDGVSAASSSSSASLQSTTETVCVGAYNDAFLPLLNCWIDDLRITKGVARYTSTFTPPTEHELGGPTTVDGYVSAASMLGAVALLGTAGRVNGDIAVDGPLGAAAVLGLADFTHLLPARETLAFVCDLITPDGDVRVPISSFQATLQVNNQCFASCVVPAALRWLDTLTDATAFRIARVAELTTGATIEVPIITAPLSTLQLDQGPTNYTASLSGYIDAFPDPAEDPPAEFDRTLQGVRTISTYSSGVRVRSSIDWMLWPGARAFYGEDASFIVSYINLYAVAGTGGDAYMDAGERTA